MRVEHVYGYRRLPHMTLDLGVFIALNLPTVKFNHDLSGYWGQLDKFRDHRLCAFGLGQPHARLPMFRSRMVNQ
jgi:hypothetical protein